MKRYMICPIIGAGTQGNPYRAAVADVSGAEVNSLIPSNQDGSPRYGFAFCRVAAVNFTAVLAITNSYAFPDFPLDSQMSGMESEARTGMVQSVEAYNMDGQGFNLVADHDDTDSFRQVIEAIAKQIEPAFNANTFDVSEAV